MAKLRKKRKPDRTSPSAVPPFVKASTPPVVLGVAVEKPEINPIYLQASRLAQEGSHAAARQQDEKLLAAADASLGYDANTRATYYRNHWQGLEHRTGLAFAVQKPEELFVVSVPSYARCDRFDGIFRQEWNMGEEYRPGTVDRLAPLR